MKLPTIRWRKVGQYFISAFLLFLLLFAGVLWYTTTDSFQRMVRGRLIAAIERATGGQAELGSFHVVPLRFQVEVRDLTVHGKEPAGEIPYVHVDSMVATINLSAALGARVSFHSLILQHPVVHVIFYPDGSTNQPIPKQKGTGDFEQLLAISIAKLDVRHGELFWQDQRLPLEFTSNDISADLTYSFLHRRYSGHLAIGKAETQFDGYRPVAWAGQAGFAIDRNGLQVQSLKATAEGSRLEASGFLLNFRTPSVKASYDVNLDLTQAASVAREPQLKGGILAIRGVGSWSNESFASSGKFDLRNFASQNKAFNVKDAAASGFFSLDPKKLAIFKTDGKLLRGSFTAEAEILNWQASAKRAKNSNDEQRGTLSIKASDVSLSDALASLGPQFRPVNRLKFAGSVSGTSEIGWKQSVRNAHATIALSVTRPTRVQVGQIPLTASARAVYDLGSGDLEISNFAADSPATQMRASGSLSSSNALTFSFATSDMREWQPVTSDLFPAGLPFVIHGHAAFNGTANGKLSTVVLSGNLQGQDFDTLPSGRASAGQLHWDSLSADVQASSHRLTLHNAVFRRAGATLKLDGSAGLIAWKLAPDSPLHFRVDVENAEAAEIAKLAGYDSSVSGKLNANFELTGSMSKPEGQGRFNLSQGSIQEYTFDSANAFVTLKGTQLIFKDLRAAQAQTQIAGSGSYDRSSQAIQLNLTGKDFDLAAISPLQRSRIKVAGKLDFSAQASGTATQPEVTADLHVRSLALNDEIAGDFALHTVSHGTDLRVTGQSDFKNAELLIDGNVQLRDQWPAHIDFHFARLDIDSFLETYLHGHVTGHSAVAGDLVLQGPLRNPQELSVAGNLTDLYADIQKVKIRNDGPIRFAVSKQTARVETFHILGENSDFSASGSMQLGGDRSLDFQGHGKLDLQLIQGYNPDLTSWGTLTGDARVTGTLDAPLVRGQLQVQNGSIADVNLPSALTEINGVLVFSQNQISVKTLSARTGGGEVKFTGHAELVGRQINFDLRATGDNVRLRYPPGVSSTADAVLHWSGSSSGSLLSGDITIIKLGVTPGFDFGTYLERTAQVSSIPQTDPVLNNIRLDLHVVTTPELQMQTSVVRLQGEADMHVRGNAAKPVLLGRADVFEGEAYFNGTKYRLERGGVTFANPAATTPFLDLEATTRVRDYDITLSLTGEVGHGKQPKMNYRSEPPLPSSDIITLLAFGQTTEQSAQLQQTNQSAFSQQASSAMLAAALNATLNNRAQRLFGNSRIKIDPQGLATETSPTQSGPAVTIEQQVKDNFTITYTTNVAQTSQQIIRAEYNISRNVSIVAIRDQNGVVSFDVKIRRRRR